MSETPSQPPEKKQKNDTKKITVSLILSWFFGVTLLLLAIPMMVATFFPGLMFLIMAAVLLPPINKFIEQKSKHRLTRGVKAVVLIGAFVLAVATTPTTEKSMKVVEQQKTKEAVKTEPIKAETSNNQAAVEIEESQVVTQASAPTIPTQQQEKEEEKGLSDELKQQIYTATEQAGERSLKEAKAKYPNNQEKLWEYDEQLLDKYYHEIAKEYGVTREEVSKISIEIGSGPPSLDDKSPFVKKIKELFAEGKPERVIDIRAQGQSGGGYMIEITYRIGSALNKKWARMGIMRDSMKFAEQLFTDPQFGEVKRFFLKPHANLLDKYGNESEGQVAKVILERKTAEKINWKNITTDDFEQIVRDEGQLKWLPVIRD